ncbi:hypothetical protein M0802_014955 [Mischocyttarus mexicanus]|nr:hypothetical protein M0802_014955 [Mischocyttarus mexicanus]
MRCSKDYNIVWTANETTSLLILCKSLKKSSNAYIKDTLKKRRRQQRKKMRILGEILLWSKVEKDYDVAWTRNCTFSKNKDYNIVWTANGTFYRNYKSSNLLKRLRRRCMDRKMHIFHKVLVFCPLGNERKKLSIVCFKVIPEKQNVELQVLNRAVRYEMGSLSTLEKRRRQLRKKMRIFGKIELWIAVEKDYDDVAWTENSTFSTRNYKSSDLLQISLKKISNVYIKDTLKKSRRQQSKKMRIFGKIKFWRTVEKEYDAA